MALSSRSTRTTTTLTSTTDGTTDTFTLPTVTATTTTSTSNTLPIVVTTSTITRTVVPTATGTLTGLPPNVTPGIGGGVATITTATTLTTPLVTSTYTVNPIVSATPVGPGVPPNNQFLLGAWINWNEYPEYKDTPAAFDARIGYQMDAFEDRQSIPAIVTDGTNVTVSFDGWDDNSSAAMFLTVYADQSNGTHNGLDLATQDELNKLANQLHSMYLQTGRNIYMRYCPEMNGPWMIYNQQSAQFKQHWIRMANTMRALAPEVMLVWSPNFDLNSRGDQFGTQPYWPGPEYVDWVGTSQYWKPSQNSINTGAQFTGNFDPDANYFITTINYVYSTYAAPYNKPFVISEASAAWEVPLRESSLVANKVSQPQLQYDFWSQVFSAAASGMFPLFRMAYIFEYTKPEDGYQRDFRVTFEAGTRDAFVQAIQPLVAANRMQFAGPPPKATTSSSSSSTSSSSSKVSSTSAVVSTSSSKSAATAVTHGNGVGGVKNLLVRLAFVAAVIALFV